MGIGEVMKKRAIFLDRDGVLNDAIVIDGKPYAPESAAQMVISSGVPEALMRLKAAGFFLIGATNQPDVSRGKTAKSTVEEINNVLMKKLPLDEITVCYHDDHDNCDCRKPKPGLLLQSAEKYQLSLADCYMVGDRWRDIEAGQKAGCQTVWIDYHYAEKKPNNPGFIAGNFVEAAEWILKKVN